MGCIHLCIGIRDGYQSTRLLWGVLIISTPLSLTLINVLPITNTLVVAPLGPDNEILTPLPLWWFRRQMRLIIGVPPVVIVAVGYLEPCVSELALRGSGGGGTLCAIVFDGK